MASSVGGEVEIVGNSFPLAYYSLSFETSELLSISMSVMVYGIKNWQERTYCINKY